MSTSTSTPAAAAMLPQATPTTSVAAASTSTLSASQNAPPSLTNQQRLIVALLAFLQFTILLDFMVLAPLGATLLSDLGMDAQQFGLAVSVYAWCAGISGIVTSSVVDRFDRKHVLLTFYIGFLVGTALCGAATSPLFLLLARLVTGIFGGVIGSLAMAIVADLFPLAVRGRVMGTMQTAMGAAQIAGVPGALWLAGHFGWHAPFFAIAGVGVVAGTGIGVALPSLRGHIRSDAPRVRPLARIAQTLTHDGHAQGFATTMVLALGFMLSPFLSAFFVHNLQTPFEKLPVVFAATGVVTVVVGPLVGRLADRRGKLPVFFAGSALSCVLFVVLSQLHGAVPLVALIVLNALLYVGNSARMVPAFALLSAVPSPSERGAFLSLNASIQQMCGGLGAFLAALVVVVEPDGTLRRFDVLCFVVVGLVVVAAVAVARINARVAARTTPRAEGRVSSSSSSS